MRRSTLAIFAVAFGFLGIAFAWAQFRTGTGSELASADASSTATPRDELIILTSGGKHTVTPRMLSAANLFAKHAAPEFWAKASNGTKYSLREIVNDGPIALLFIKDGCPCSVAAAPYYNRLHDAYGSRVRFFGVIDADVDVANRWALRNQVPFPILSDPGLRIVREYNAENSAYFALIARGGTIEEYWPGYSAEMLEKVNGQLARLAGVEPRLLDVSDAPATMYTGCPF